MSNPKYIIRNLATGEVFDTRYNMREAKNVAKNLGDKAVKGKEGPFRVIDDQTGEIVYETEEKGK